MIDPFDPKRLSFSTSRMQNERKQKFLVHRRGEKFLKGPIPWMWLAKAAKEPGKTLHVAISIWHLVGIKRTRTIALTGTTLRELGVNRYAAYRALKKLESIGLVSVVRHLGQSPIVTILENESDGQIDRQSLAIQEK